MPLSSPRSTGTRPLTLPPHVSAQVTLGRTVNDPLGSRHLRASLGSPLPCSTVPSGMTKGWRERYSEEWQAERATDTKLGASVRRWAILWMLAVAVIIAGTVRLVGGGWWSTLVAFVVFWIGPTAVFYLPSRQRGEPEG